MLLWLFQSLGQNIRAFNVFNYLTLRAVLAVLTSMGISFVVGPWMIHRLKTMKFGQAVRDDGPQSHLIKAGTPTMGGALILVSVTVATLFWMDLSSRYVWIALFTTLGFGIVGWVDDYKKIVHKNPKGLIARWKYLWQSLFGIGAALAIVYTTELPAQTELIVP
ncbi:MAG: phospho-N-acetylmuramoyl-pentapeptide-transferase, partial [Thiobacillaceae bacterium]